jgi:hypothetical protein
MVVSGAADPIDAPTTLASGEADDTICWPGGEYIGGADALGGGRAPMGGAPVGGAPMGGTPLPDDEAPIG